MNHNKVIVFGIDGGTWDVINPMIERGQLPNLKRLRDNGVWSDLSTTFPSQTVPAWPSCLTGVNPGKLGVFHFLANSHLNYDEGRTVTINDLGVKTLWELISENQKKVIGITVPLTYPPPEVNGVMISPIRAIREFGEKVLKTYPPELYKELQKALDFNISKITVEKSTIDRFKGKFSAIENKKDLLARMKSFNYLVMDKLKDGALYLMENYEWDFMMLVFIPIDGLQHHFWCFMDENHPAYDSKMAMIYGDVIPECYRKVDNAIGEILKKAGEDVTVLIVSDHGFGPLHKILFLNYWLKQKGLLYLKEQKKNHFGISTYPLESILYKLDVGFINKFIPNVLKKIKIPIPRKKRIPISELIDWQKTKAYATSYAININLEGREPNGVVDPKEYNDLVDYIKKELYKLQDPETEESIVYRVYEKKEIYDGPFLEKAPDIQFVFKDSFYSCKKDVLVKNLFYKLKLNDGIYAHHVNSVTGIYKGIFLANGRMIKKGTLNNIPNIIDIAPTALYLMGLPVPKEMDGKVLSEIIREDYFKTFPISYDDIDIQRKQDSKKDVVIDEDEERRIKESLRDLGYLG